ncbi:hypothetical protein [Tepidibacillus marianensis]|uniref:hypothetical protein n=1 Tax=Tepidibacillus marianensis TaxID=3131995 RepID=UPI0030CCC1FA
MTYSNAVSNLFKDWKKAIPVIVLTIARLIYGWKWFEAGWEKLEWLGNGKADAAKKIQGLIDNLVGPKVHGLDPLYLNKLFAWIADKIFLSLPGLTDVLVVSFEMLIGIVMIIGFRVFWGALVAMFLNTQFMAAGSGNNFGYIWTNLVIMKWTKYVDAIGVDGFLRFKKGKDLL